MGTKTCPVCGGSGQQGAGDCSRCGGSGSVPQYGPGNNQPGDNGCFPGYSKVMTANGWSPIEKIKRGDKVLSINKLKEPSFHEVIYVARHKAASIITVSCGEHAFDVTPIHTIKSHRGWLRVEHLQIGDLVYKLTPEGELSKHSVTSMSPKAEPEPVYNLIVEGDYTFVVDGCIAHSFTYLRNIRMLISEVAFRGRRLVGRWAGTKAEPTFSER